MRRNDKYIWLVAAVSILGGLIYSGGNVWIHWIDAHKRKCNVNDCLELFRGDAE